jgi:hypothetical protein
MLINSNREWLAHKLKFLQISRKWVYRLLIAHIIQIHIRWEADFYLRNRALCLVTKKSEVVLEMELALRIFHQCLTISYQEIMHNRILTQQVAQNP